MNSTMGFAVNRLHAETNQIIQDVFRTMMGLDVEPATPPDFVSPEVTAAVFLAGAWKGAVLIECSRAQAFLFTSRLMPVPVPERVDDDVRDALGELTNMIGGNLKAFLPAGAALSMPTVVEGSDYSLRVCGGNHTSRSAFICDAGVFTVTLVEVRS